jgi:ferredoxin
MANSKDSFTDNAPGPWYVDEQCICCGLCEDAAPEVFRLSDDGSHNLVHRQPATPQELADAENARDRCPVEAIGKDREEAHEPAAASTAS